MNTNLPYYDVAIIGGGLAGLATAIQLGREGVKVILFEKETYPFHKVCGEYLSLESEDFIKDLGVTLDEWELPQMDILQLSSPGGNMLQEKLPLGGFGVSRFRIDYSLMQIATQHHVQIREGTKVNDVQFADGIFTITTDNSAIQADICCGTFGKRSNLDVKWKRPFVQKKPNALNNYIGVKYHVILDHPRNMISLHNFKGGYCGIAPIEDNKTNLCYLTRAQNLRDNGNNLQVMEEKVLFKNPFLKKAFTGSSFLYDKPLTISQISFDKKEQVHHHILLLGDAAGLITPLCGNGMSMALRSSKIAVKYIIQYLKRVIDRNALESLYTKEWRYTFAHRLKTGRVIQEIFRSPQLTSGLISLLRPIPFLTRGIISKTHG